MVDPWKVDQSKKLVHEVLERLAKEHCPDCGSGHVRVAFKFGQTGRLEYHTKCPNCGKEQVY